MIRQRGHVPTQRYDKKYILESTSEQGKGQSTLKKENCMAILGQTQSQDPSAPIKTTGQSQ